MTSHVTSADGTRIAFDRLGHGPAVIVIGGMFCARQATRALAEQLAQEFTVINYDRRGRADSGDTPPYSVQREIEDLGVLIAEAGGSAAVYGHSSGAGLALEAAARGCRSAGSSSTNRPTAPATKTASGPHANSRKGSRRP